MSETTEIQSLWSLLLSDPQRLSDEQIAQMIDAKDGLMQALHCALLMFPSGVETVKRYRTKKAEWMKLPFGTLMEMSEQAEKERIRRTEEISPVFEPIGLDSDLHILCEILREKDVPSEEIDAYCSRLGNPGNEGGV